MKFMYDKIRLIIRKSGVLLINCIIFCLSLLIPKTNKIIVKGVNIRKKHVKPRRQGEEGGIIPAEYPIHSSKVGVVCPKCGKVTRIAYKVEKDSKVRVCKKCNAEIK